MTPDQLAAVVYRHTARDLADAAWRQTRAALDGDGGVSIARRAAIAEDTVEMLPIESDRLDARDEARRAAEDEERERWDLW